MQEQNKGLLPECEPHVVSTLTSGGNVSVPTELYTGVHEAAETTPFSPAERGYRMLIIDVKCSWNLIMTC